MDILVIKFGTASITLPSGEPDEEIISSVARQVAWLHPQHRLIIVSSGAVGAGKQALKSYEGTLTQRKAAAAVGNPILVGLYARHFAPHGISIAQSLCERAHFADRAKFLQLKNTFETLWQNGIIPIVNENDVVSDRELKFSDNDELATLIAAGFGAKTLMLCTSAGGVRDRDGQILRRVPHIDDAFGYVQEGKSALGLGGMTSKLTFAKRAVQLGIRVVIFGMQGEDSLLTAWRGESGTEFGALRSSITARNRWLASGGLSSGRIYVDAGAAKALLARKSLLAVGIVRAEGDFAAGEIVEIRVVATPAKGHKATSDVMATSDAMATNEAMAARSRIVVGNGETGVNETMSAYALLAVGRVRISSAVLRQNGTARNLEVAHANDIVVF
jgi:glutamate 5-kinase